MDRYKIQQSIGNGTFGVVYKGTCIKTGEVIAIKKMKKKFYSWDECMSLKELKCLKKLNHPNLTKLKEVVKVSDELYFVFEYLDKNIYQMYTEAKGSGKTIPESQIRSIIYQTATGLAHMHKAGFFHRDLKPENLLMSGDIVKIGDFGLAREIRSRPPYTEYIATRWYRAPEILVKSPNYNSPVDIFALGCIMAELYLQNPLFSGHSELDQLHKICSVLGTPSQGIWNEGYRCAAKMGFTFPHFAPTPLSSHISGASDEALHLMAEMFRYDPQRRPSAQQILQHPFFTNHMTIERMIPPSTQIIDGKRDKSPFKDEYIENILNTIEAYELSIPTRKNIHASLDNLGGSLDNVPEPEIKNMKEKRLDLRMIRGAQPGSREGAEADEGNQAKTIQLQPYVVEGITGLGNFISSPLNLSPELNRPLKGATPAIQSGMVNAPTINKTFIKKYHLPKIERNFFKEQEEGEVGVGVGGNDNLKPLGPSAYDFLMNPKVSSGVVNTLNTYSIGHKYPPSKSENILRSIPPKERSSVHATTLVPRLNIDDLGIRRPQQKKLSLIETSNYYGPSFMEQQQQGDILDTLKEVSFK